MAKLIHLKLAKIKYGGEIALNAEIGQFAVEQASTQLSPVIKIIEQDAIFNDVGSKQVKIKIDLRDTAPHTSTHDIPVKELRGLIPGRATAIFSVTIQTQVSDAMLYVAYESTKGGWLNARPENAGKDIALPAYLKVRSEKHDAECHYFQMMEGAMRGKKASVKIKADNMSYFQSENPRKVLMKARKGDGKSIGVIEVIE